jgi:hypothetical protein
MIEHVGPVLLAVCPPRPLPVAYDAKASSGAAGTLCLERYKMFSARRIEIEADTCKLRFNSAVASTGFTIKMHIRVCVVSF